MSRKRLRTSITFASVLFLIGISLYLYLKTGSRSSLANPPTILGVTIRESRADGELVIHQEINFYDDDGNTNMVNRELVDLSDPSQRQNILVEDSVINDLPEIQKIRSTAKETWHCEGHVYVATLEVFLSDKDDNQSETVRYSIECR